MSSFPTNGTLLKNVTSLDSSRFVQKEMLENMHEQYVNRGHTDVLQIVDPARIAPLQHFLYEQTKYLLEDHDSSLSIEEKLNVPMRKYPDEGEWSKLMHAMNGSSFVKELIVFPEVKEVFEKVFLEPVEEYPISKFRAQYPGQNRAIYNWHQDEGTWYAVPIKALAHRMPATLWFSINGANEHNSIEIMPYSNHGRLENHFFVDGQGYFNAHLPKKYENSQAFVVKTKPGQGIIFHPLTFHRSIKIQTKKPRYSVDIRYCTAAPSKERYKVQFKFYLKRLLTRS